MTMLTGQQIADERLTGWAYLLGGLQTRIATPDFAAGLALVNAIAAAAGGTGHLSLELRETHVDVRLTGPDEGGVDEQAVRLAQLVTTAAAGAGLTPATATISRLELGLDTPDRATVLPFWAAALGLEPPAVDPGVANEVRDPAGVLPTVWFQPSGLSEPRQRWHPDVWLDPGQVQPRIDAALAAGGTLVSDAEAPAFWVLADPEGNQVCLCTWQDRD